MTGDLLPKSARITVAIVEDDTQVRTQLAAIIGRAPGCFCIGEYASGENALEGLRRQPARVALMDINLPGMSGVDCVRQLAASQPDTQVIVLTVHQDADTIFEALSAGASGYMLKPVRKDELIQAIRDVVAGGSPMTSSIARKVVQSFKRQPVVPEVFLEKLSDREHAVLELLAQGFFYKEIGEKLDISIWTVSTYIHRIYKKLHVKSRAEALARYRTTGGS